MRETSVRNEAKRRAQEALFAAIEDQAQHNMKAALRPAEKAQLLRDLAEAYRLAAGASVPSTKDPGEASGGNGHRRPRAEVPRPRSATTEAARDGATAR
ncbi:hypothetical protein [Blastococcus sp. SYSU D00813]